MSTTQITTVESHVAGVDLAASQGCAVVATSAGLILALGSNAIRGILLDKPSRGDPGAVATSGICEAQVNTVAGGAPANTALAVGMGGVLIQRVSGVTVAYAQDPIPDSATGLATAWLRVRLSANGCGQ
jgi:hypothetical protein